MPIFFSVIIPTYNRGESLRKALDSLAEQTFKNFEVMVCDDGSKDHTEEVVKSYANKLTISYHWAENWGGPARPRNIGIKESKGEWICFLDSDDWWYPNKLEECAKYTDQNDLIFHSLDIFDCKKEKITGKKVGRDLHVNVLKDLIINGNGIANSSVVIKKSMLEKVGDISEDKLLIAVEDYDLWLRTAKITNKFKFIEKSLGAYNWDSSTNISQISEDRIRKEHAIFEKYIALLDKADQKEATRIFHYKLGRYHGVLGQYALARKYLRSALFSKGLTNKLKSLYFYMYFSVK